MSKKDASAPVTEVDLLLAPLEKQLEGIVCDASELLAGDPQIIPFSPNLDLALGGGVPEGSIVIVKGPPKSGKTSMLLSAAANAQKPENGGRIVFYGNVEARLRSKHLRGIRGLDLSPAKFRVIGPNEKNKRSWTEKEFLTAFDQVVHNFPGCFLVVDSFSALCGEAEMEEVGKETRGGTAKSISGWLRKNRQTITINRCIVTGVTHLMSNTSGYGAHIQEKSGRGLGYFHDTKIYAKKAEPWLSGGETGKRIGQVIEWLVEESAIGPPGVATQGYLRYGVGIDAVYEGLLSGVSSGVIAKAGAWLTLSYLAKYPELLPGGAYDEKLVKGQGAQKIYELLMKNPAWLDALRVELKSRVCGPQEGEGE